MKYKLLLFTLLVCGIGLGQTLVSGWTFDSTPAVPNTPNSIQANLGSRSSDSFVFANGTNGSSSWITATSGNELTTFGGDVTNDPRATQLAGNALSFIGGTSNSANGKKIVFKFSMLEYENPILTFITRGTSTGFNTHVWEYSTDNVTYSSISISNTANNTSTWSLKTIDLSAINALDNSTLVYLRLTLSGATNATGNNRIDNILISATPISTTYTTSWSNNAPTASVDAIIDGDLATTTDLVCKDLTINAGKTLTIGAGKKLTVAGNLINNGTIVFKSDATGTAMFDVFNGTQSGTGVVTVERFIPQGKRAFRLLSPAVTTTTFISGNWQQGTHITGGATGGFDVTETNNPSMFTYNNQVASGTGWTPIANTNATNLSAGVGYRVLIRGDRNVNLNSQSNGNMNASVTLAATGALKTGAVTLNSSSIPAINDQINATTANYSLVGNPYASAIDWHTVTKTGIEDTYYAWDPNLGTGNDRGRYVSYSQSTTTTSILNGSGSTNIGRHIQSGQAFFVKNTVSGTPGTLTFNESNKSTTQAAVFRSANTELAKMYLTLYDATEFSIGGYPIDGTVAVFGQDFETNLGVGDVQKLETNGQNVMFLRDNKKLVIEATSLPVSTDELQVINTNAQPNKNYTWRINMSALPSTVTPYLVDAFLGTQTALSVNQEHIISFATTDAVASTAINRFKIVFTTSALHNDTFTTQIGLYPNPTKGNGFNLQLPSTAEVSVKLFNTLGQEIGLTTNGSYYQATQSLPTGVYYIMVTQGMQTSKLKWIVE